MFHRRKFLFRHTFVLKKLLQHVYVGNKFESLRIHLRLNFHGKLCGALIKYFLQPGGEEGCGVFSHGAISSLCHFNAYKYDLFTVEVNHTYFSFFHSPFCVPALTNFIGRTAAASGFFSSAHLLLT